MPPVTYSEYCPLDQQACFRWASCVEVLTSSWRVCYLICEVKRLEDIQHPLRHPLNWLKSGSFMIIIFLIKLVVTTAEYKLWAHRQVTKFSKPDLLSILNQFLELKNMHMVFKNQVLQNTVMITDFLFGGGEKVLEIVVMVARHCGSNQCC